MSDWSKKNTVIFPIRLNLGRDADILAWLDRLDNKSGTVKQLMRNAIRAAATGKRTAVRFPQMKFK